MNIRQQGQPSLCAGERIFAKLMSGLVARGGPCNIHPMLNIASLFIGGIALFLAIFAFLPFLGWANWVIVPFAILGLALGALSNRKSGRNLNLLVILVGVGRLMLGGGIF